MIQFSDNPEKAIEAVRIGLIRQLQESNLLKLEDYEDLFHCEITGLKVPSKYATKKEIDKFRRQLKATLIKTSATEFSFAEVAKVFHEPKETEIFEKSDIQKTIQKEYERIIDSYTNPAPSGMKIIRIDASKPVEQVHKNILDSLQDLPI